MKKHLILLPIVIFFYSCCSNNKETNNSYQANISKLAPWIEKNFIKEVNLKDKKFVAYIDSSKEFSYGFRAYLKDINVSNPKKIKASCEVLPFNIPSNVQLVLEMKENDTNIFWKSEKITNGVAGEWKQIILEANIPQNLNPNVLILVYLWSPSKETAFADNFTITFE